MVTEVIFHIKFLDYVHKKTHRAIKQRNNTVTSVIGRKI